MNATTYKNGMNEGGEGYNPYTKHETCTPSRSDRKYRLLSIMTATSIHDPEYDKMSAEVAEIDAEIEAEFIAEWTVEVTQTRRATWNAWAMAAKATGRKISGYEVAQKEQELGFSLESLKKAITLNAL